MGLDFSGRGFNAVDPSWPRNIAQSQVLDEVYKELNLEGGIFRLQFDLWEFVSIAQDKELQNKFLENYSQVINQIDRRQGTVLLNLYGMPPGLGRVLDKRSSPQDFSAFKGFLKEIIRYFSCEKGYNVWYEVWSAPDLENFFLGEKQEYLRLYQATAEAIMELEKDSEKNIPLGGPSISWWFQNLGGNSILEPQKSLIYELMRFCRQNKLPLDFISWHAYSSYPFVESEETSYGKSGIELIREWLSYFELDPQTPLVVSEWNYDTGITLDPKRDEESHISASYIPSRIRNMASQGIDYQILFCLQDFKNEELGINRNLGLFKEKAKRNFYVVKMINSLGNELYTSSRTDLEFFGIIATKREKGPALLLFNYIDPEIAKGFVSSHLSDLAPKDIELLLDLTGSQDWEEILKNEKLGPKLSKANKLNEEAKLLQQKDRIINLKISNLKGSYLYEKYVVDQSDTLNYFNLAVKEKEITSVDGVYPVRNKTPEMSAAPLVRISNGVYEEKIILKPYSVVLILLGKNPEPEPEAALEEKEAKSDVERN